AGADLRDYAGADLRTVELAGLDLQGVRWSETTRWPPRWENTIREHSVRLPGGGYEYRRGGADYPPVSACTRGTPPGPGGALLLGALAAFSGDTFGLKADGLRSTRVGFAENAPTWSTRCRCGVTGLSGFGDTACR